METDSHPVVSNLMHNPTCVCTDTQAHIYKRHTQTHIKENAQGEKTKTKLPTHSEQIFLSIHTCVFHRHIFIYILKYTYRHIQIDIQIYTENAREIFSRHRLLIYAEALGRNEDIGVKTVLLLISSFHQALR